MDNEDIVIFIKHDGDLHKGKSMLECKCPGDVFSCTEYDTAINIFFELKKTGVVILKGEIHLDQEIETMMDNKVYFRNPIFDEDDKKNFIIIEPNKKENEYSSISPEGWYSILLALKKRINQINKTKDIFNAISTLLYTRTYLEEYHTQSIHNGIDFREITDNMGEEPEDDNQEEENEEYEIAIEAELNLMTLVEISDFYGGIEDHIMKLCVNYFLFLEYEDAYFWDLCMMPLTSKEIINVMGYRRTKDISKVEKLFDLLKENDVIKRFDEDFKKGELKELNHKIKNSKNKEKVEKAKEEKIELENISIK